MVGGAAAHHRAAAPHTRLHLSQPTARFAGTPEEIAAQNRQQQELLWKLYGRLARRAGGPAEETAEDFRRHAHDLGEVEDRGVALGNVPQARRADLSKQAIAARGNVLDAIRVVQRNLAQ